MASQENDSRHGAMRSVPLVLTDEMVERFGAGPFQSVDFCPHEVRELWALFMDVTA